MKIKHLTLDCASLQEQKHFYTKKFDFEILSESDEEVSLAVGESILTFRENRLKKPYYHFAFNIPFGALELAANWVRTKVEVITTSEGEIQKFKDWKARAVYFLDPAGNIVELIGRKRISGDSPTKFSKSEIMNISEVGLPVTHVREAYEQISELTGLEKFDCTGSSFCAGGTDEGLFIIVDKTQKTWFPTNEVVKTFPLTVNFHTTLGDFCLELNSSTLTVESKS